MTQKKTKIKDEKKKLAYRVRYDKMAEKETKFIEKTIKKNDTHGFLKRLAKKDQKEIINKVYLTLQAYELPVEKISELIYLQTMAPERIDDIIGLELIINQIGEKQGLTFKEVLMDIFGESRFKNAETNRCFISENPLGFYCFLGLLEQIGIEDYKNKRTQKKYGTPASLHRHGEKIIAHGTEKMIRLTKNYLKKNSDVSEEIEKEKLKPKGYGSLMDIIDSQKITSS
ncbi:hypothetical protein KY348_07675 [Candidatus Woesearchaeota archaeon]|nr:hypothetical protein [Candidatus Woesearchaeota archaeon]